MRELLAHDHVVAVGESGLDGHHGADTLAEQRVLFDAHLALAEELALPIVVHSRAASRTRPRRSRRSMGRWCSTASPSPSSLTSALERRYYVSFAGNVTYPRAEALRAAAARVPSDRILAETDSPYLAPQPLRGRRNEPASVMHTLAALAAERGESASALEVCIDENADRAFGLDRL